MRAKETVVILLIAVTLVAGAIATGCGSSSSMPGPNNPPGQSSSPTPSPSPSPSPTGSPGTVHANEGGVLGTPGMFTAPSDHGGAPVDGITCDPTMSDNYHIHIWIGVYVNGVSTNFNPTYALPIAIGMQDPGPPGPPGAFITTAKCFYHIHTHDSSGIVHVEDPDPSKTPITGTLYTLKQVFDIWGVTVNGTQVDKFVGPVRVYTSGQVYRGNQNGGVVPASTLTQWTGDPNAIPLYSHEVIMLEVGPTYPAQLPNVAFYTEF